MRPWNFQGNVHIINFPAWAQPAHLAELFDEFGIVLGAEIKEIESDGGELRMGIVSVAPDKAADKAIEALQGYVMGGQKLKLKRAKVQPRPEPKPRTARPARPPRPAVDRAADAAEMYPAVTHAPPPRQVIVEYRGRRSKSRISL